MVGLGQAVLVLLIVFLLFGNLAYFESFFARKAKGSGSTGHDFWSRYYAVYDACVVGIHKSVDAYEASKRASKDDASKAAVPQVVAPKANFPQVDAGSSSNKHMHPSNYRRKTTRLGRKPRSGSSSAT
jgi:hypothetical protein